MAQAQIKAVITAEDRASSVLSGVGASFGKLAGAMAVGQLAANAITSAIDAVASASKSVLDSAADFEQSRVAFDTMLGSADKARVMLKQLSDFSLKTPFTFPEVVTGAKQLLAYGISAEKILPDLKALGDIAAGVGRDKLPFLTLAFGQVATKGKLMGQEIRQFTEAGVPIVAELAKSLHKTTQEITDMSEKGQISFANVEAVMKSMTGEGGNFFNLMEKQSKTFDGVMSNLNDNFMRIGRNIIGISDEGDIKQGGIFYYLTQGATAFMNWLDAHREGIISFFNAEILPSISALAKHLADFVTSDGFKQWLKEITHWIAVELPPFLNKLVTEYIPGLIKVFSDLWPVIQFTAAVLGGIVSVFQWVGGAIEQMAYDATTSFLTVVGWVASVGKAIEQFGYDAMSMFYAVADAFNGVVGFFGGIGNKIKGAIQGAGGWLYDTGKNIVQGLLNGINNLGNSIGDTLKNWAKGGVDAVKKVLGIKSPSTVFAGIGENIGKGLEQGIVSSVGAANDTLSGLITDPTVNIGASSAPQQSVQPAQTTQTSQTTVNISLNVGMYAGSEIEKRKVAKELFASLQEVANQQNTTVAQMMGA